LNAKGNAANAGFIGFIYDGIGQKQVIVRGVGQLISKMVPTAMQNPTLEFYNASGQSLGSNDNWEATKTNTAALTASTIKTGLPPLPTGSLDAALLANVTISGPTSFTMKVGSSNGLAEGITLAQAYEVP
jgi:hypothetical protein